MLKINKDNTTDIACAKNTKLELVCFTVSAWLNKLCLACLFLALLACNIPLI